MTTSGDDSRHELWVDVRSGALWAVELHGDALAGCHGPLLPTEVDPDVIDLLDYTTVGVPWLEAHRERFSVEVDVPFIPPT